MFSSRQLGITRLFFILQQMGVLALFWLVFWVVNLLRFEGTLSTLPYIQASFLLLASAFVEYFSRDRETRHLTGLGKSRLTSVSHRQTLFAVATIFGAMVMFKDDSLSRVFIAAFFFGYFLWISWGNLFGHRMLHRALYRTDEKGMSRTLLVGSPVEVDRFCSSPQAPRPPGTDYLGYIPVGPDAAAMNLTLPSLGDLTDLKKICEETKARALLLLGLQGRKDLVTPVTNVSSELGLRTMWVDDVNSQFGKGFQPFHTGHFSVVSHLQEPLEDPTNRALKRIVDLVFSSIAIALVLPPAILLVKALQAIYSPGPLFYRQMRSGRNGEAFKILKFRTMHFEPEEKFEQAREGDPRIYRGAKWVRKFSIDELPQLLNVFFAEMSLVGPRPHPLPLDETLSRECSVYRMRNLVKPGLTGLAQSRGWRGETRDDRQLRNRVRLDLFYVQKWSLSLDFRIMLETASQLVKPPHSAR